MSFAPHLFRSWPVVAASAVAAISLAGIALYVRRSRQPTEAELESQRRDHLSLHGRIIDGVLLDAWPDEQAPATLLYRYRVAGVMYECAQDISALSFQKRSVRVEFPVQVRYNRDNPGDSIVLAETWNGLWNPGPPDG